MSDSGPVVELDWRPGSRGRIAVVARLPGGQTFTDELNVTSAECRQKFMERFTHEFPGVPPLLVRKQLETIAAKAAHAPPEPDVERDSSVTVDSDTALRDTPVQVKAAAEAMLKAPDLIQLIVDDIAKLGVAGEKCLTMILYLIGTSRLCMQPLAGIVQGGSASGKSYPIDEVAGMFPSEAVIKAKKITPQALFHMPQGALIHKFVVAGERSWAKNDEVAEATRTLREMLSDGKLAKLMPVKGPRGIETQHILQDGPIAFVESTTQPRIFNEDENRCILIRTDEGPEQTMRVYRAVAQKYSDDRRSQVREEILQRHHTAQRMLRVSEVVIPFAPILAEKVPANRIEGRRAIGHLMNAISAVALLHQFQREKTPSGAVIATLEDYRIVQFVLDAPLSRLLGCRASRSAMELHAALRDRFAEMDFTTTQAVDLSDATDRMVRTWLSDLASVGAVEMLQEARGSRPARWKLAPDWQIDQGHLAALPSVEEILWCWPEAGGMPGDEDRPLGRSAAAHSDPVEGSAALAGGAGVSEVCRNDDEVPTNAREN